MREDRFTELTAIARRRRDTSGLAAAVGTTKMTLSRWARGEGGPTRRIAADAALWASRNVPGVSFGEAEGWLCGLPCPALSSAAAEAGVRGAVRVLREARSVTQEDAARHAGVARATWIAWERRDDVGLLAPARRARAIAALADAARETFPDGNQK